MAGGHDELARLLRELKSRSGRSYDDLARQALVSRSALHRYCTGKGRPPDAETILRVTRACGATDEETRTALAAWIAHEPDAGTPAAPEPAAGGGAALDEPAPAEPATDEPAPDAPATDGPAPDADTDTAVPAKPDRVDGGGRTTTRWARRRARRWWMPASGGVALLALLGATLVGGVPWRDESPADRRPAARQWVPGPAWSVHPKPVDPALFGVTVNSDTGEMPAFRIGSGRFWDSGTRWAQLEKRRGEYDWDTLDRLVDGAERAGVEKTLVLGGTPAWAAPDAPPGPYPDDSRAGAPDDLSDWDRFVGKLAHRYRGRIDAYELWNIDNDKRYYNGPQKRLVEMTRRASDTIRDADPDAQLACPGITELWRPETVRTMHRFAQLGGYRHCDAVSIKLHQRKVSDPPESALPLLRSVGQTLHREGVGLPIWNTGVTYDTPIQPALPADRSADYAARFFLTALYGHAYDLRRTYFYNFGSTRVPIVLQGIGGSPTQAAMAVERLQGWLAGTRIAACGQGRALGLPTNAWQCEFRAGDRRRFIRWTDGGTAASTVPPDITALRRLDGSTSKLRPGAALTVSGSPVLLTSAD